MPLLALLLGDADQQATYRTTADGLADQIGQHAFGPTLGVALGARL